MKITRIGTLTVTARSLNPGDTFQYVGGNKVHMILSWDSLQAIFPLPENCCQPTVRLEDGFFEWVNGLAGVVPVECEAKILEPGRFI